MKVPVNNRHSNSRFANQEKADERETWHKLVVKIINWKDESTGARLISKITPKEWNTYSRRMLKTNTSYAKQRVLSELEETKQAIKEHGGFEEPPIN